MDEMQDILDRSFTGTVSVAINRCDPVQVQIQKQPLIYAVQEAIRFLKGGLPLTRKGDWTEGTFNEEEKPPILSVISSVR